MWLVRLIDRGSWERRGWGHGRTSGHGLHWVLEGLWSYINPQSPSPLPHFIFITQSHSNLKTLSSSFPLSPLPPANSKFLTRAQQSTPHTPPFPPLILSPSISFTKAKHQLHKRRQNPSSCFGGSDRIRRFDSFFLKTSTEFRRALDTPIPNQSPRTPNAQRWV